MPFTFVTGLLLVATSRFVRPSCTLFVLRDGRVLLGAISPLPLAVCVDGCCCCCCSGGVELADSCSGCGDGLGDGFKDTSPDEGICIGESSTSKSSES